MLLPYLAESAPTFVPESEPGSDVYRLIRHVLDALEAGVDAPPRGAVLRSLAPPVRGAPPGRRRLRRVRRAAAPGSARLDAAIPGFVRPSARAGQSPSRAGACAPRRDPARHARRGRRGAPSGGRRLGGRRDRARGPAPVPRPRAEELPLPRQPRLSEPAGFRYTSAAHPSDRKAHGPADPHPEAVGVLGVQGLPPRAAVRRRGGRRDDAPGHVPPRPRPRAVGRALRPAVAPPGRRALRRRTRSGS